jgi:hypothetical protein
LAAAAAEHEIKKCGWIVEKYPRFYLNA